VSIFIGDPVELSFRLTMNGIPASGRSTSVRVVKVNDGSELLAETVLVEGLESGLYNYTWMLAPTERSDLMAIFKDVATGKTFSKCFEIEERRSLVTEVEGTVQIAGGVEESIIGIIEDADAVTGSLEDDDIEKEVDADQEISSVSTSDVVDGSVDDEEITGTLDCCQ